MEYRVQLTPTLFRKQKHHEFVNDFLVLVLEQFDYDSSGDHATDANVYEYLGVADLLMLFVM
tara:strand:+ start:289 stop:474 length:186 start_codon:yes stop_codon:yes gene_type:complete